MPSTRAAPTPDPAAAFARWQQEVLAHSPDLTPDLYADNVVVEAPFTGTGQPHRIEGLAAYTEFIRTGRASLPFRFTGFEDVLVHHTEDPATAVVEYRLLGQGQDRYDRRRSSSSSPWTIRAGSPAGASTRTGQRSRPPLPLPRPPDPRQHPTHVDHEDAAGRRQPPALRSRCLSWPRRWVEGRHSWLFWAPEPARRLPWRSRVRDLPLAASRLASAGTLRSRRSPRRGG